MGLDMGRGPLNGKPEPLQCKVMNYSMARDMRGNEYVQYRLRISQGGRWKDVSKRYSEITDFASHISYLHDQELCQLAPKKPWLSFRSAVDPKITEERKKVIGAYMDAVLDRRDLRAHPETQNFLEFALHAVKATPAAKEEEA